MSEHLPNPEPVMSAAPEASPAERRRMRVRAAILDAAEKVFTEEGEDGLSIRRLAEEIDYSPAAIYKYFESKEELVEELKELFFARILERVGALRESDAPFEVRVRQCLIGYVRTALEKPQHYLAAFTGVQEDARPVLGDSNKARAFDFLSEIVREGQELGYFNADVDQVALATSVWASLHGAASLLAHMPELHAEKPCPTALNREAFLDLHAETVLNGLLKR